MLACAERRIGLHGQLLAARFQRKEVDCMPTLVSECAAIQRELWTAEDFLGWLQPGVHADLIQGEKAMHSAVNLRHARLLNFLDFRVRQWMAAGGTSEDTRATA
jgi:hypothetical protein